MTTFRRTRVSISVSEPWDLAQALKWRALRGEVVQTVDDDLGGWALIRLDDPVKHRGSVCRYFLASPRLDTKAIFELLAGDDVFCAFRGVSDQLAESGHPLDTSRPSGGLVFLGDAEPEARAVETVAASDR